MLNNDFNLAEMLEQATNSEEMANAIMEHSNRAQEQVLEEFRQCEAANFNSSVLQSRGVRTLTTEERTFYEKLGDAMRDPRTAMQAITDANLTFPLTVIDAVFEDLIAEHPLLSVIDFQNTTGATEFLYNAADVAVAKWGAIDGAFTEELTAGFKKIPLTLYKLSAFLPISKAMLDLGAEWLDRYVRVHLAEAIANGLEEGIINGNGLNEPTGMIRDLDAAINPTTGAAEKTAETFKGFTPQAYAPILKTLSTIPAATSGGKERHRSVNEVVLIVNPVDYVSKVYPSTTLQATTGSYNKDVFPYPTRLIESEAVPEGKAIMGIGKRYFFGLGTGRGGVTTFSDDYRFLEDERVYAAKLYGNGIPKDNNAFVVLDISGLKPSYPKVTTVTE